MYKIELRAMRLKILLCVCFPCKCLLNASLPENNTEFWCTQVKTNRARGIHTLSHLMALDLAVRCVWEHENAVRSSDWCYATVSAVVLNIMNSHADF